MTQETMPWADRAKQGAEAAKGSSFQFVNLETDGDVSVLIPGGIVSRESKRFGGERNQTRVIVLGGTYYSKDADGDPVAVTVPEGEPLCLMLGMGKMVTQTYKAIMRDFEGAGLPILKLVANPKRKGFEPGMVMSASGERADDETITRLVGEASWTDAVNDDVPF